MYQTNVCMCVCSFRYQRPTIYQFLTERVSFYFNFHAYSLMAFNIIIIITKICIMFNYKRVFDYEIVLFLDSTSQIMDRTDNDRIEN